MVICYWVIGDKYWIVGDRKWAQGNGQRLNREMGKLQWLNGNRIIRNWQWVLGYG